MNVKEIKEHEDGSASYQFDMTPDEHEAMCRNGIVWAIISSITGISPEEEMRKWLDSDDSKKTPEIKV